MSPRVLVWSYWAQAIDVSGLGEPRWLRTRGACVPVTLGFKCVVCVVCSVLRFSRAACVCVGPPFGAGRLSWSLGSSVTPIVALGVGQGECSGLVCGAAHTMLNQVPTSHVCV